MTNVRNKITEEQIECLNEFIEKLEEKGLTPKEREVYYFCHFFLRQENSNQNVVVL